MAYCINVLILLFALSAVSVSDALSSEQVIPRQHITFVNPIDKNNVEKVPASYISSWPTWVLDSDGIFIKIRDGQGFVNPTSIDELWQPIDLIYPEMRLAVGLHVRNGQIRHIMPAIDLSYNKEWRNRGMCTVPRAHTWLNYIRGMEKFVVRVMKRSMKKRPAMIDDDNNDDDYSSWDMVAISSPIGKAIEHAMEQLSDSPPNELGDGSHIIGVLIDEKKIWDCPRTGNEIKVTLGGMAEKDAAEAPGILQVVLSATRAGSESEYLPQVYKPLYEDKSYLNQAYKRYKAKLEEKKNVKVDKEL